MRSAVPGVSPGRGLLIPHGYLRRVNANIAKCKVTVFVMDGFRRFAHARVITDLKIWRTIIKSERIMNAQALQTPGSLSS